MAFPDPNDPTSLFPTYGYDTSSGDQSTADPSQGTQVQMPDGTFRTFPPGEQPYIFIGDSFPGGWAAAVPGTEEYDHYQRMMTRDDYQGALQVGAIVGGAALANLLSGAAAASSTGNVGAAGGSGSGSAVGGGGVAASGGTTLYPYGPASTFTGTDLATGATTVFPGAGVGAGTAVGGGAAIGAGAGAASGALTDITNPGQYVPGPGNGVPLPVDQTLQPMPSPPDFGTTTPPPVTGGPSLQDPGSIVDSIANDANQQGSGGIWQNFLKSLTPSDLLSLGGNLLSGYLGSQAANKATDAQTAAYQAAIDEQKREYDLARSDYAPYLAAGTNALGKLQDPTTNFQASPDYEFRKTEGTRNVLNGYNAAGGAFSGNALKALADFNSNLASGEFGNWWNRQAGLAGVGQTATNSVTNAGTNAANATGNFLAGQGDSRASGVLGRYGSYGNALNNIIGNYLYGHP